MAPPPRIPRRCVLPTSEHYQRMFAEYERSRDVKAALLATGIGPVHGTCHVFTQLAGTLAKAYNLHFSVVTYTVNKGTHVVPVINGVEYDMLQADGSKRTERPDITDIVLRSTKLGSVTDDVQNAVINVEQGATWNEYVFTATVKGVRAGQLTAAALGDYFQVRGISVRLKYQRMGLATKLYWAAYMFGRERGMMLMSDSALSEGSEGFWKKQAGKGRAAFSQKDQAYIVKRGTTSFDGVSPLLVAASVPMGLPGVPFAGADAIGPIEVMRVRGKRRETIAATYNRHGGALVVFIDGGSHVASVTCDSLSRSKEPWVRTRVKGVTYLVRRSALKALLGCGQTEMKLDGFGMAVRRTDNTRYLSYDGTTMYPPLNPIPAELLSFVCYPNLASVIETAREAFMDLRGRIEDQQRVVEAERARPTLKHFLDDDSPLEREEARLAYYLSLQEHVQRIMRELAEDAQDPKNRYLPVCFHVPEAADKMGVHAHEGIHAMSFYVFPAPGYERHERGAIIRHALRLFFTSQGPELTRYWEEYASGVSDLNAEEALTVLSAAAHAARLGLFRPGTAEYSYIVQSYLSYMRGSMDLLKEEALDLLWSAAHVVAERYDSHYALFEAFYPYLITAIDDAGAPHR